MTTDEYYKKLDSLLLRILRVGVYRLPKELRQEIRDCALARIDATQGDPSTVAQHRDRLLAKFGIVNTEI